MSSNSSISAIIEKIAQDNTVFGKNYFVFKDNEELSEKGLSDRYFAMIYARRSGVTTVNGQSDLKLMNHQWRIVAQVSKKINKESAEMSLRGQIMSHCALRSYSCDAAAIYKQETGKDQIPPFHVFAFDVYVQEEVYPGNCEFLTIDACQ
jgi:hypothetical protein